MPENVIGSSCASSGFEFGYGFFNFSAGGSFEILFKSRFFHSVKRFCAVRLQVHVDGFRPTTGLICFGERNTLPDKSTAAVEQFSGFRNGEEGFAVRHLERFEESNWNILPWIAPKATGFPKAKIFLILSSL